MDSFKSDSHPYYLANLADDFDVTSFYQPKQMRVGSNFSELKSVRSTRSRFTSNNKLLKNNLFSVLNKSKEGFIRDMHRQRNYQIQLLMEMFNNLVKDGVDWVNHVGLFLEKEAEDSKQVLQELEREK